MSSWYLQTKSSLNPHPTPTTPFCILMFNKFAKDVQQHKHLGLIFNNRLNWKDLVAELMQDVLKLLDVLHKLSRELGRRTLETIYENFVKSKLEYACIIWDCCFEQDSKSLENCQLRAARITLGIKKGTSHNKHYCETQWSKQQEKKIQFQAVSCIK